MSCSACDTAGSNPPVVSLHKFWSVGLPCAVTPTSGILLFLSNIYHLILQVQWIGGNFWYIVQGQEHGPLKEHDALALEDLRATWTQWTLPISAALKIFWEKYWNSRLFGVPRTWPCLDGAIPCISFIDARVSILSVCLLYEKNSTKKYLCYLLKVNNQIYCLI